MGRLSSPEFKVNPNLSRNSTTSVVVERWLESVTGVGSVAVGHVLEKGLAFFTVFGSVMAGVLERGCAFDTGFGATVASVSFVFAVGVGATKSAASSLVAALSELRDSPAEEDIDNG